MPDLSLYPCPTVTDPTVYPNLNLESSFWTPAGPQDLPMKGNMYLSGGLQLGVAIYSTPNVDIVGVDFVGTGAVLVSYTGTKFGCARLAPWRDKKSCRPVITPP